MRAAAASQGVKETVDFCVDCQAYKLLFSEADRKPRAKLIHNTYLQAGCDTPVNLPDTMIKSVEKELNAEQCGSQGLEPPRPPGRPAASPCLSSRSPSDGSSLQVPFGAVRGMLAGGAADHERQHLHTLSQKRREGGGASEEGGGGQGGGGQGEWRRRLLPADVRWRRWRGGRSTAHAARFILGVGSAGEGGAARARGYVARWSDDGGREVWSGAGRDVSASAVRGQRRDTQLGTVRGRPDVRARAVFVESRCHTRGS